MDYAIGAGGTPSLFLTLLLGPKRLATAILLYALYSYVIREQLDSGLD